MDCEEEKKFRNQEIDDAETALDRIVPEKNMCESSRDSSKAELVNNREDQNNAQTAIQDANNNKDAQDDKYSTQQTDTADLLAAIDECITLMQSL